MYKISIILFIFNTINPIYQSVSNKGRNSLNPGLYQNVLTFRCLKGLKKETAFVHHGQKIHSSFPLGKK